MGDASFPPRGRECVHEVPFNWAENLAQPQPQVQASRTSPVLLALLPNSEVGWPCLSGWTKGKTKDCNGPLKADFTRVEQRYPELGGQGQERGHNDQSIQSHSSEKWLLPSRVDDSTGIQISKFLEEWIPNVPATETWEVGAGERLCSWEQALFLQKTCVWFPAPSLGNSRRSDTFFWFRCHTPTCN